MTPRNRLRRLLDERKPGFSLPQDFYLSPDIFALEMEAIFAADWIFACNGSEIARPGDFVTLEIGDNSVIVLRDRNGLIRAYHNTCRHRGSRLCNAEAGRVTRLTCPYHQWVYELDGRLLRARQMPEGFDTAPYGLAEVKVEVICGMVYLSLAEAPPDLARFRAGVTPYIAPHHPQRTKVAHSATIIEEANWKLVIENNRECYHCVGNHPELLVTLVEFALPEDAAAQQSFQAVMDEATTKWDGLGLPHRPADGGHEFRCIRLPFNAGAQSFTMDGASGCRKLLGDFTDPALGSVRMFRVPNNWNHFLADHILHFRVLPLAPDRTAVRTTWLVHEDAVEGVDYDIERLTEVWSKTNDQDKILAENNHRGIRSRAYRPGPLAPSEFMLRNFAQWYAEKMEAYLSTPGPA